MLELVCLACCFVFGLGLLLSVASLLACVLGVGMGCDYLVVVDCCFCVVPVIYGCV